MKLLILGLTVLTSVSSFACETPYGKYICSVEAESTSAFGTRVVNFGKNLAEQRWIEAGSNFQGYGNESWLSGFNEKSGERDSSIENMFECKFSRGVYNSVKLVKTNGNREEISKSISIAKKGKTINVIISSQDKLLHKFDCIKM